MIHLRVQLVHDAPVTALDVISDSLSQLADDAQAFYERVDEDMEKVKRGDASVVEKIVYEATC